MHVWIVLRHDGDGVTLLANDEPSLLLRGVPQVNAIVLQRGEERGERREGDREEERGGEREERMPSDACL